MTEKSFINGMNYLKSAYINWAFDMNSQMQIRVWYDAIKQLNDEEFIGIVKEFIGKNKFPPQSPVELLDVKVSNNYELSVDEAWNKAVRAMNEYSFDRSQYVDYDREGNRICYTHAQRLYASLCKYPVLSKTVKDYETLLDQWDGSDYLASEFKKSYERNLKNMTRDKVLIQNYSAKQIEGKE